MLATAIISGAQSNKKRSQSASYFLLCETELVFIFLYEKYVVLTIMPCISELNFCTNVYKIFIRRTSYFLFRVSEIIFIPV